MNLNKNTIFLNNRTGTRTETDKTIKVLVPYDTKYKIKMTKERQYNKCYILSRIIS